MERWQRHRASRRKEKRAEVPKLGITQEDEKRVAEFCGVYHRWLTGGGFILKRVEKDFAVYQDWTKCWVTLSLRRFGRWVVKPDGAKEFFGTGFDDLCKVTAPVGRYSPQEDSNLFSPEPVR